MQAALPIVVTVVHCWWMLPLTISYMEGIRRSDTYIQQDLNLVRQYVDEGNVIIAYSATQHDLDFDNRWVLYHAQILDLEQTQSKVQHFLEAEISPLQKEMVQRIVTRVASLSPEEHKQMIRKLVRGHREAGRKVYVLFRTRDTQKFLRDYAEDFDTRTVAEISGSMQKYVLRLPDTESTTDAFDIPKRQLTEIVRLRR